MFISRILVAFYSVVLVKMLLWWAATVRSIKGKHSVGKGVILR